VNKIITGPDQMTLRHTQEPISF